MTPTKHFPKSPSSADRRLNCPGSRQLVELIGEESRHTSYADEGTLAHAVAADWLMTGTRPTADAEMLAHVGHYVTFCLQIREQAQEYAIEHTMQSLRDPDFGGTPDFLAVYEEEGWIVDLKYGAGVVVLAEGNAQLKSYALLASELYPRVKRWSLTIVQPRTEGPPVDSVEVTAGELAKFREQLEAAEASDTLCVGDHCRWCPAKAYCPELRRSAEQMAQAEFSRYDPADDPLELQAKITAWRHAMSIGKAIKWYLAACEGALLDVLKSGKKIEGLKAVRSLGYREWIGDEAETLKKLSRRKIGKRTATKQVLLSPSQLEKLGFKTEIEGLYHRPERGIVLAPATDRRPAVELVPPGEEFAIHE